MNWPRFFKVVLINVLLIPILATIIFGAIGYFSAGWEGAMNAAGWGVLLGALSIPFSIFGLVQSKYWGDFAGRASWGIFKKTYDGTEEKER
jgi:hypothetical protein